MVGAMVALKDRKTVASMAELMVVMMDAQMAAMWVRP